MAPTEFDVDYYAVLEISNTANLEVVAKSYRRLAKIRHPDKNLQDDSTAVFQLLQNAYDTISDPAKRRAYDTRWAGIKDRLRTQQESDRRQAEAAETERKWANEEKGKRQKEDGARQERLERLELFKSRYDSDIFEVSRVVRKLTADLKRLRDLDDEDLRKERERASWWTYLASSVYGKVDETDEQKQAREIERLQRLASKSIKGSELQASEAKLQRLQDALQGVNSKITAEKKRVEDEARERKLRMEQEARNRAQQNLREYLARAQKEQDERAAKEAREAQAAKEASEALERVWKAAAAERCKREAEERTEKLRAAKERLQEIRAAEERAQRLRRAEAERAEKLRAAEERLQEIRAAEERAQRRKREAEERTPTVEEILQRSSRAYRSTRSNTACQHNKFWPKIEGSQHLCSKCHAIQKRFAFQCPGCRIIACASCRQALRGEKRKAHHSGRRSGLESYDTYDDDFPYYDFD